MACKVGEVEHDGYCVPSYLTPAERILYVEELREKEAAAKKANKRSLIILGALVVAALGFAVLNFVA